MPCYKPLVGYYAKHKNSSGKRSLVFNKKDAIDDKEIIVSCGQCIGCRLEYSRKWAVRCVHEASLYKENSFITLTYNNENLPEDGSLVKDKYNEDGKLVQSGHFQLFMKRLRARYPNIKIRYFMCGEYGEKNMRPHYHACLFNFDFEDKELWQIRNGISLFRSSILEDLWPMGFSTIGEVTFESAAYVARYVLKKVTGEHADAHYLNFDRETGELYGILEPEFTTMSRRPGIGKKWLEKYYKDVYPKDTFHINGKAMKPPRYYDDIYDSMDGSELGFVKMERENSAINRQEDNTQQRLVVKHNIQVTKQKRISRKYEDNENED